MNELSELGELRELGEEFSVEMEYCKVESCD